MKLIEQYLEVVGQQLPWKGRAELKAELRSLLLDEIEAKFGDSPTEEQVKSALKDFGAPEVVARRYNDYPDLIAGWLVPLYFLLLKIVLGALSIAFFVLFILSQVQVELDIGTTGGISLASVLTGLGTFVLTTLNAYFSAVGVMTLIFLGISRFAKPGAIDLEDDWSPDELKDVQVGPPAISRVSSIVSLVVLSVLVILMNIFPTVVTVAEDLFELSTIELGHRLNIPLFRFYIGAMTIGWIIEMLQHGLLLARGSVSKFTQGLEWAAGVVGIITLSALVSDSRVYLNYERVLGFRLVFIILLVVSVAELGGLVWKAITNKWRHS